MRRIIIALVIFFTQLHPLKATGDSLNYLLPTDTIFLHIGRFEEKMFMHQIEKKQTLFSLAKFYGLSVEELYWANPGLKDASIHIGYAVKIPIPNRAIIRYTESDFDENRHAPIYYKVKKGDTMYRIAKYYFRMPVEDLQKRNEMEGIELKIGQDLFVGWMHVDGIPEEYHEFASGPLARRNNALSKIYRHELGDKKEIEEKGPAIWQTKSIENSDLYCLHAKAPINSIVRIENPMSNRTVYAKVVGRIPATRYEANIKAVLSPLAAKLLGAIDPRFYVRVYYKK